MKDDVKRSNYFKVRHDTPKTLWDIVRGYLPELTDEAIRVRAQQKAKQWSIT